MLEIQHYTLLHTQIGSLNDQFKYRIVNTYRQLYMLISYIAPSLSCSLLQLIFSGEYTKAMDKDWHSGHFCCWQCDESLTGQRYVIRDDHPYCIKCYENVFANTCEECNKIIGIDSKVSPYLMGITLY